MTMLLHGTGRKLPGLVGLIRTLFYGQVPYWAIQCRSYSGTALLDQLEKALSASKKHRQNHKEFTEMFNAINSNMTQNWNRMVENWQQDPKALNPFEEPIASRCPIISY